MALGKLTTAFLAAHMMNGQAELKHKIEEKDELDKFVANIRLVSNDFVNIIINQISNP